MTRRIINLLNLFALIVALAGGAISFIFAFSTLSLRNFLFFGCLYFLYAVLLGIILRKIRRRDDGEA